MKLWTGDEWRKLSDNEAAHRIDVGDIVLEDDDPRTKVNKPPSKSKPNSQKPAQGATPSAATARPPTNQPAQTATPANEPSEDELERLTAPTPKTGDKAADGGDRLG